jgi:methylated-DNA-[protein]-cysteine S-methyltransferase
MVFFRKTAIGKVGIEEKGGSIVAVYFESDVVPRDREAGETPLIRQAFDQLEGYLAGRLTTFTLPLAPEGTPFMRAVWRKLQEVPYGQTASYKEIASAVGNPKAVRAVGQANNRNPIPIFIPCHRIIGKNGSLVGYGGGLALKERLLELEKRHGRV